MGQRIKKQEFRKTFTLREYYDKRNKILIWHEKGGLGDVLMQRMMMEDFKKVMPDAKITFACLPEYIPAIEDHPFIDEVCDSRTVDPSEFTICYNTCVTIADRYENKKAPFCTAHRSDIWANYCGLPLTEHKMHFQLDEKILCECKKEIENIRKPGTAVIAFAPVSKMISKTLLNWQIETILNSLKDHTVVGMHKIPLPELEKRNIPGMYHRSLKEWMCLIACSDYVISVDTAAFHMAGGLNKPLMGIFTFADGKIYGKYFDFVLVQKHRDNGWDCGPCFTVGMCPKCPRSPKPCLTELTAEELTTGVKLLFAKWPFV